MHEAPSVGVGVPSDFEVADALPRTFFQINFFPDLVQIYFLPFEVLVVPAALHFAPDLTAPKADVENEAVMIATTTIKTNDFFTVKMLLSKNYFVFNYF